MKRAVPPQMLPHSTQGLFGGLGESALLTNLLTSPKSLKEYPFVDVYRRLNFQRTAPAPRTTGSTVSISQSFEPSKAALALMTQSAVSTKHLDAFLESNYISGASPAERVDALDRGLYDLVAASTPNNLRTVMLYLARYWQCGLFGSRPMIRSARNQARYVLQRALAVHPATEHANGGEQVGVPDLQKFETFVTNFFDYLGVQHLPDDELEELLLRLSSQSGTLAAAMTQILSIPPGKLTEDTMQCFLDAFAASKPSRKSVEALKNVFLNRQTGPAVVKFLLPYSETTAEVFDLLDIVDRSALRKEVYNSCSLMILGRLLHLSANKLGLMFAYLARREAVTNCQPDPETSNLVLRTALSSENKSAINQALRIVGKNAEQLDSALVQQAKQRIDAE